MSVEQTKYGTWRVRWRDIDGTQRAKSFRTRSLAEKHERKVRAATDEGKPTVSGRREGLSLTAFADQWLDSAHNLSPGALTLYREDLDRYILPALGTRTLRALEHDPTPINEFLANQLAVGRAATSVHRYWRTLRRMFRVAAARGKIDRSPILDVQAPRVPKVEMRFLDAATLEALAAAANRSTLFPDQDGGPDWNYSALILTAGWGGLRWGECAGLKRRWVDHAKGGVHVMTQWTGTRFEEPKGGNKRFVLLPASVMELLDTDGGLDELVFTMPRGGPLVHSNWRRRVWVPAKAAAGVDAAFRFHDLRHTAVALAIKADAHPEAVKRRLGWSTIALIDTYGHLLPGVDETIGSRLEEMRAGARRPDLRAV